MEVSLVSSPTFLIAILAWTASEGYGALTHALHRWDKVKLEGDKGSLIAYYVGIFAFLLAILALPSRFFGSLPDFFYVGVSLMFAGIVVRQWAIAALKGSFSLSVVVRDGQKVVDTGPYRAVRHPSYTGITITIVGFGLALGSPTVILISGAIFLPILAYRITVEEMALKSCFGEQYLRYMERTKRLIPYIF